MPVLMTILFLFFAASLGIIWFHSETNRGRLSQAQSELEEAQTLSKVADTNITTSRIQKETAAKSIK